MVDWTQPMGQTFEFYEVDPGTWCDTRLLGDVAEATIERDLDADTLGSATLTVGEDMGEAYVRAYIVATQGGESQRECLGTFLVQTTQAIFDGKAREVSADAYTPLLELGESMPEPGYTTPAEDTILSRAARIAAQHCRAPVVAAPDASGRKCGDFTANLDDTWLTFTRDLLGKADYRLALDERGRILFQPKPDANSQQPVYAFSDGNSSILLPDVTLTGDVFGIPNVVEVVYGSAIASVENSDPASRVSTATRGRRVVHRESSPSLSSSPTEEEATAYARNLLRELSTLEYEVSFTHGYVPNINIGDCVRLDYARAGIHANAVIRSQSIACTSGCEVTTTASYTVRMWV